MRDVIFFLLGALAALLFAHGVLWWERRRMRKDRERWERQQAPDWYTNYWRNRVQRP